MKSLFAQSMSFADINTVTQTKLAKTMKGNMMNSYELKVGRINAVLYASEDTIKSTNDKGIILMAKEIAYDQIKQIMDGKCPWKEGDQE